MAPHKPFDPRDHIPANWGMTPTPSSESRLRSRALVWVALGLTLPIAATVCYVTIARSTPIEIQRDTNAFEKNVKPSVAAAPDSAAPSTSPADPKEETPAGLIKMNYSTENVKMEFFRKEGSAVAEKKKKKDDFLGNPLNDSRSTDVDDRAKGPGGPDK